jgi:hypothetical protein
MSVDIGDGKFTCPLRPCHSSILLHTHLSAGAGSTGQLVADIRRGLSLTPPQET